MPRIAVYQANTGVDPAANAADLADAVAQAAKGGADMLFTPEMSGLLDRDRSRAAKHIVREEQNEVLTAVTKAAARDAVWIALGSLAVARDDGRWANRSFLIDPDGRITARYDKIHMFDVDLDSGESWRESSAYAAGEQAVVAQTPLGRLGLAICYDMRFPRLFDALGEAGCEAISIPAAFTVPTGQAHWHILLRARAIEASAYVIAAAQAGCHADGRTTFGHSLVIDPWGEVILDMGAEHSGVAFADIDPHRVSEVRRQLPSLANRRQLAKPRAS